jgi:hypothetical protein
LPIKVFIKKQIEIVEFWRRKEVDTPTGNPEASKRRDFHETGAEEI